MVSVHSDARCPKSVSSTVCVYCAHTFTVALMKLKRVLAVIGVVALYLSPGFILLAVALGMKWDVAVFIYLGAVIVIRIVFNIDY